MTPGTLVFPDQLIDYSWGREHTFHSGDAPGIALEFIDFTTPYSEVLRNNLIRAARDAGVPAQVKGTYGVTQGPRLETAAEIDRLERDGCDIVGMTGMPETALARELGMHYASCSFVVNWAAGRSVEAIHDAMGSHLQSGMLQSAAVLRTLLKQL
jgi:purine nucleoside phosphorylase